jgi:hypothetical protein
MMVLDCPLAALFCVSVLQSQKSRHRALNEIGHYRPRSLAHHGLASKAALHGLRPNYPCFLASSSATASSRTPRRISSDVNKTRSSHAAVVQNDALIVHRRRNHPGADSLKHTGRPDVARILHTKPIARIEK